MIPTDPTAALFHHRFLLFTGKGGVGKTTIVAALAVHAARTGLRPLVVELGHRQSMRSVFGVPDIGFEPKDVGLGVHAISIDFDQAVLAYMVQHLPSKRLARTIVHNNVLERLFKAMPAVGEIVTLNRLRALEAETAEGGPRWSPILVDLDATGHAMMFLELRHVLDGLIGAGPMLRLIESTAELFADPHVTRLCLVATPDELPVTETVELYEHLIKTASVAFGRVLVNRVPEVASTVSPPVLDAIDKAARLMGQVEVQRDVAHARERLVEVECARAQIERLAERVPLPIVELPRLLSERMNAEDLAHLGALAVERPPTLPGQSGGGRP